MKLAMKSTYAQITKVRNSYFSSGKVWPNRIDSVFRYKNNMKSSHDTGSTKTKNKFQIRSKNNNSRCLFSFRFIFLCRANPLTQQYSRKQLLFMSVSVSHRVNVMPTARDGHMGTAQQLPFIDRDDDKHLDLI